MYTSLKDWINVPVQIKTVVGRTGTGARVFGEVRDELCYPKAEIKVVRNLKGEEVVSNNQLFFDGNTSISYLDIVVFEGAELSIHAITTFYRNGKPDLKVVYI